MKKFLYTTLIVLLIIFIGSQVVNAIGSLTPSGNAGDDTQYSLNDIYDKLTNFTDTPTGTSSPFTTPGSVSASFRTLTEIYDLLVSENSDLVAGNIADGITIFGVEGTLQSGVSNIEWSVSEYPGTSEWSVAISFCDELDENGTGWRLPTILELLNSYLNNDLSGFNGGDYWSSVENPITMDGVFALNSQNGSISIANPMIPNSYARCVR